MRFSQQPWGSAVARLELVVLGVGQVGLNPTVAIQRLSDAQWLAAGGGAWGAGFAVNNLVQIDAANQPGMYEYAIPGARLDYVLGAAGYRLKYVEVSIPVLEYEYLEPKPEFSGQVAAGDATAGAAGSVTFNAWAPGTANFYNDMLVTIVGGTGKGQSRAIVAYSAGRVATVVPNWGTNPDATSVVVVHASGAADVRAWLGAVPNVLNGGNVQADVELWRNVVPLALAGAGAVQSDVELWRGVAPDVLSTGKVASDLKLWLATAPNPLTAAFNVKADVEEWRAAVPSTLNTGSVQVDVQRWLNVAPNPLTAALNVKADVEEWRGAVPVFLTGAGFVGTDLQAWRGVVPVNLVGAGAVVSDVELWRGVVPTALAASGNVRGDLEEWRGVVPNALVAGRVDADVGAIQAAPRDAIADQVWDELLAGHVGAGSSGAALTALLGMVPAAVLASGTVASTTGTTTTLDAGSAATASYYVNAKLVIISGTGAGQERVITGYSAGRVATHAAWTTNPTGASKYAIIPGLPSSLSLADIMTASMASYETAGTFGNHVNRILRLRQENMKVVYTAWATNGQPTAGYVLVYASSADLATDVSPWALAKGRYDFTATYNVDLQLTGYQSARTL